MPESNIDGTYHIQVIGIYATRLRHRGYDHVQPLGIELGKLSEFYETFRDQLPRRIGHQTLPTTAIAFTAEDPQARRPDLRGASAWLFALPSDQVVGAVVLDVRSPELNADPSGIVRILEAFAYSQIELRGESLASYFTRHALDAGAYEDGPTTVLPAERYQVVFAREMPVSGPPGTEMLNPILYRIEPPYRQEFMPLRLPRALNQEARTFCAVTPYVSLLFGHQDYVRNSVFLTTVQAVGTAARFQEIWHEAYRHVQNFRQTGQKRTGEQRRADLEELVDELGNLELDLSFSVETPADLGLLIPSLRIESFHHELYRVMELVSRAKTVSQMFMRLDSSIKSELRAIEIRERREEEQKRMRGAIAVSALSVIGVPLGFLVAFFGINAVQVNDRLSIFDFHHYLGAYLAAGLLALVPVLVFLALHSREWLRAREERRALALRTRLPGQPAGPPEPGPEPDPDASPGDRSLLTGTR